MKLGAKVKVLINKPPFIKGDIGYRYSGYTTKADRVYYVVKAIYRLTCMMSTCQTCSTDLMSCGEWFYEFEYEIL